MKLAIKHIGVVDRRASVPQLLHQVASMVQLLVAAHRVLQAPKVAKQLVVDPMPLPRPALPLNHNQLALISVKANSEPCQALSQVVVQVLLLLLQHHHGVTLPAIPLKGPK